MARARLVLAAGAIVLLAIVAVVVFLGEDHAPRSRGATYAAPFRINGLRTPHDVERLRGRRHIPIVVLDGFCLGSDERAERRFKGVAARQTSVAVTASARMEPERDSGRGDFCAGIGSDFAATMSLRRTVGPRALIAYVGPYQFRYVLVPPTDRQAARDLVLPIRRDRKQPPPLIYAGPACDEVARFLHDVPHGDWCFD